MNKYYNCQKHIFQCIACTTMNSVQITITLGMERIYK